MTDKPYFSMEKRSATPASRKYIARRPKIANRFEVSTMNGSVVTAKIAGILSTAKMTSLSSTRINTSISGVTNSRPFLRTKNFSSSMVSVMRKWPRSQRTNGLSPIPEASSFASAIFTPVNSRNAPNTYSSHSNWVISQLPAKIMIVRRTIAPSTPYTNTRRCNAGGTEK